MTGIELTDRLIEDIAKSVQAKNVARSHSQLKTDMANFSRDIKIKSGFSIEEGWISLTCDISLPYSLGDLSQLINHSETLVSYKSGDKVDLVDFLNQVTTNKANIAATFQNIKDNPNLVALFGQDHQTLFSYLKAKLDDVHNNASSVENCYKHILAGKTS